jgi:hypothetical protein
MTRAVLVGIVAAALLPAQELTIIYWGRDSVYAWNASLAGIWWLAQTEVTARATVVAGIQPEVGITPRGLRVDAAIAQWVRTGSGSRVGFRLAHTSTHHLDTWVWNSWGVIYGDWRLQLAYAIEGNSSLEVAVECVPVVSLYAPMRIGNLPRWFMVTSYWLRDVYFTAWGYARIDVHRLKTAELYQVVAIPVLPQLFVGMAVYWATNSWYNPAWHVIRHGFSLTLLQ